MALTKITTNIIADNAVTADKIDSTSLNTALTSASGYNNINWDTAYNWGDHSVEGYATETYVDTAVSNLVDSSPETLNTLNELAAALGDDANFAATTLNAIDLKAPLESPTFTGTIKSDNNILAEVAQTKVETATSVFVYDTRKDSDGGAWRKRTQHTSWYNEPLNTATRGSRRDFPAVAVIVAEANKVTIYDGDDPSLPMWMVFEMSNGDGTFRKALHSYSTPVITSIASLNGNLVVTNNDSGTNGDIYAAGVFLISFIKDQRRVYRDSTNRQLNGWDYQPISLRNINVERKGVSDVTIVANRSNDIAMTVLPNAPIDPDTGLPIPTIAVATDGGVSVIKDDGNVVDITITQTYKGANKIAFTEDNKIAFSAQQSGGSTAYWRYIVGEIPSSDVSYAYWNNYVALDDWNVFDYCEYGSRYPTLAAQSLQAGSISDIAPSGDVSGNKGLTKFNLANPEEHSMVSYVASNYNTGWMNGDIKLATLSDTDNTDAVGTELVTNGTFDTDINGWTASSNASLSLSNNRIRVTNVNPGSSTASQSIGTLIEGKTYVVTAYLYFGNHYTGAVNIGPTGGSSTQVIGTTRVSSPSTGTYVGTFTASSTQDHTISLYGSTTAAGYYLEFDNISVRLAEQDRSVNNNGLQVFGTVQKNPVATGADLVAYSGFNLSNYLEQAQGSLPALGTGDFCISTWILPISSTSGINFGPQIDSDTSGSGMRVYLNQLKDLYIVNRTGTNWNSWIQHKLEELVYDKWNHLVVLRKNATIKVYVNGKEAWSVSHSVNYPESTAFTIATNETISWSISLMKYSFTAPTPDQIKKIYEDEKVLFQENAKATLYGTSDSVTALAYDDDTNLLHVGTSQGRSVFQGLRRVDNTTDAVGAAISASNGLVVEE